MQDIQVNEYMPNTGKNVYIFCDFAQLQSSEEKEVKKGGWKASRRKRKTKKRVKVKLNPASPREKSQEERFADAAYAAKAVAKAREALKQEGNADETFAASETKNISVDTSNTGTSDTDTIANTDADKDVVLSEDKR